MSRPFDREPFEPFDSQALLLVFTAGELSEAQELALFEAAAVDQALFDQVMEAERLRHALSFPEERRRAAAVLDAWEQEAAPVGAPYLVPRAPAGATSRAVRKERQGWTGLAHSVISTVATALALRVSYSLIAAVGATLVFRSVATDAAGVPPVPGVLHLVHAAIAALLLAIQFSPFLRPQTSGTGDHPIAARCLTQFIAGWRWAWVSWLALYGWLWLGAGAGPGPDVMADVLNCLTAFPLFWCFFVLDKPSVAVPGNPERDVAFRKAIGTTWGIGAGVALVAAAGRLHLWGLNEFGLVFLGLYDGLAIAFLVGRFDSHWMKVPRWMLAPLYGYALIQMIYVFFFKLPAAWQVYTYLVALLFKVCLFLVVTHLLHAGNLRRYLEAAEDGKLGPQ